jgi:hypothetical protein
MDMPSIASFALPIVIGVIANVVADLVLATRYRNSFALNSSTQTIKRAVRWVAAIAGLCVTQTYGLAPEQIILVGLLTVTAATDFEHLRLPPSWFLYAATIAGVVIAYVAHGLIGLHHAILAQAIWFALMTLSVMLLRRTAGGDIKVVMQYGSACSSLPVSILGMLIASSVMFPISLIYWLKFRRSIPRTPLAPLTWLGAIIALILERIYAIPLF